MATYSFSSLSSGSTLVFDPNADVLHFDQSAISAASLRASAEGSGTRITVMSGTDAGKTVLLQNTLVAQLAIANVTFANGSRLLVGDAAVAQNDNANNTVAGTGLSDFLYGLGGNDSLNGGSGNDWLEGGAGNDTLSGSGGQDLFAFSAFGAGNADTLTDYASNWDSIRLDAAVFTSMGSIGRFTAGDDRFVAAAAAQDAEDRIVFNTTTRQLFYDADGNGAGAAQLIATLSNTANIVATDIWVFATPTPPPPSGAINGTPGNDSIFGTPDADTINGLGGSDTLGGSEGNDRLEGGTGNDSLIGHEGLDTLFGGDGHDVLDGADRPAAQDPSVDAFDGGLGNDTFHLDHLDETIADAGGVDTVVAHDIDWTLGANFENLMMNNGVGELSKRGVGNGLANVMDGATFGWGVELDGLGGADTVLGSVQEDTLWGGDGADTIDGWQDFDWISGGAGNDTISGGNIGTGGVFLEDTLTGGDGADVFVMNQDAADLVLDFAPSNDRLRFDGLMFTNIGASGPFLANDPRFWSGNGVTAAHDADDRIIYNTFNGDVFYDADGTGAEAARHVARLQFAPSLQPTDIEVINGGPSGSVINGGPGNDTLNGTEAHDTINGLGGDDRLDGSLGADSLSGGDGADTLGGGGFDGDSDTLSGGLGNDQYTVYASGNDVIAPDPGGIDHVIARELEWTLGPGLENLTTSGISIGYTATGNELANLLIDHTEGSDLHGMAGADTLDGGSGDALLAGGDGNDRLSSSDGFDTVVGGAGADLFVFGEDDAPFPDGDWDRVDDFASGVDRIVLNALNMAAIGTNGAFVAGDDRFVAAAAAQDAEDRVIWDGDVLWYDPDGTGAQGMGRLADLQAGATVVATDITVENGTTPPPSGGLVITGTSGNDSIVGTAGADTINGGSGNDSILGGAGQDRVSGSGGQDAFVYGERGAADADTITDYASNWDRFNLDDAGFGSIGALGRFASGDARFWSAAGANTGHDATDRIVFNTSTGQLWYDRDGSGAAAAELIATVQAGATVVATDIYVI